jgi:hypothetical protein
MAKAAAPTTTTLAAHRPTSHDNFRTMTQWYPTPTCTLPRNSQ